MGFLLNNARLLGGGIALALIAGFGIHYKLLTSERDQLRVEKVAYQTALAKAARNMAIMEEDARIAERATATALADREAARSALDELRRGREEDPEALTWGAELLPVGEIARLCIALPEMEGC